MSTSATRMPVQHLRDLYGSRTLIGFTDGQLLARYAALNDGPAFESLMARHGSMVVAACRAILEHELDVEDAFQATFLVLARKASSVRAADTLGGRLHRVAFRIALQAKNEAMKRKRLESELAQEIGTTGTISAPPVLRFLAVFRDDLQGIERGVRSM